VLAWRNYAGSVPAVMGLGPNASPEEVQHAVCADRPDKFPSIPIAVSTEQLAARYYGWHFAVDPIGQDGSFLVNGGCSVTAAPSTAAPSNNGSPPGPSGRQYLITQGVVIRAGASSTASAVGSIPAGSMVAVQCKVAGETITGSYGADPNWDRVVFSGTTGFVADQWVDTKADEADPTQVPPC
jgi:hypothetical protein